MKLALWRRAYRQFEHVVVQLALRSTWIGCASAPNADYYTRVGHPRAFYLQNLWPQLTEAGDAQEPTENRIVGNLGGQYATGNTFGARLLAREVLPALDRLLGDDYTVQLFGAGRFAEPVARELEHPHVVNRGFVDDIDAELQRAKVFLLCNNGNPDFVVGHTRILHAWSVGSCLVAHTNMAVAMPEIVHGENALLGATGKEIAEHVATMCRNPELRRTIVEGGRQTWSANSAPRWWSTGSSAGSRRISDPVQRPLPDLAPLLLDVDDAEVVARTRAGRALGLARADDLELDRAVAGSPAATLVST